MIKWHKKLAASGLLVLAAMGSTGCQVEVGGQMLPSPYYMQDDIQYFPSGPKFPLWREAAAMAEQRAQEQPQAQGQAGPAPVGGP